MKKAIVLIMLALIAIVAGVNTVGDLGLTNTSQFPQQGTETRTIQPTEQNSSVEQDGASSTVYRTNLSTGTIVLGLPDLPSDFTFDGEIRQLRTNASGQQEDELIQQGIVLTHKRVFRGESNSSDNPVPSIVLSAAVVYENESISRTQLDETVETLQSNGANVSNRTITSDITGTQIQFTTDEGLQNTIIYHRDGNLLLYIITSGDTQYFAETAEEYLVEMIGDVSQTE
jgi:hypothetical protein